MRIAMKPVWFVLALLFLAESWLWDKSVAIGRWVTARIPFAAFKAAVARVVAGLPPYAMLVLFIIPVGVILPFKLVGLWLIAKGHVVLGVTAFIGAKFAGVGATAFLFDICRERLLTLGWFARLYCWVVAIKHWAQARVAPAMAQIKTAVRTLKARARAFFPSGRLARRIILLRARMARRASL